MTLAYLFTQKDIGHGDNTLLFAQVEQIPHHLMIKNHLSDIMRLYAVGCSPGNAMAFNRIAQGGGNAAAKGVYTVAAAIMHNRHGYITDAVGKSPCRHFFSNCRVFYLPASGFHQFPGELYQRLVAWIIAETVCPVDMQRTETVGAGLNAPPSIIQCPECSGPSAVNCLFK